MQTHVSPDGTFGKPFLSYHDTEQTNAGCIHCSVGGFCKRAQHGPNCGGAGINRNLMSDSAARAGIGYHCPKMSSVIDLHILQSLYNYLIIQSVHTTMKLLSFLLWTPCCLPWWSVCFPGGTSVHLQTLLFSWFYRAGNGWKHFKFQ